jgi:tRNA-specific 2-thiouridylase
MARHASLPVAEKEESQDICFVTQNNYQEFISERVQGIKPGAIVDMRGNILGRHRGIIFYTIGQRSGLRISHPTPLYVVSIDPDRNQIVVGEKEDLKAVGLIAGDLNMLARSWPGQAYAKIRYRKKEAPCEVTVENNKIRAVFKEAQEAITPGQSVVFYAYDCVLGGGVIEEVFQ